MKKTGTNMPMQIMKERKRRVAALRTTKNGTKEKCYGAKTANFGFLMNSTEKLKNFSVNYFSSPPVNYFSTVPTTRPPIQLIFCLSKHSIELPPPRHLTVIVVYGNSPSLYLGISNYERNEEESPHSREENISNCWQERNKEKRKY